MNKDEKLVPIFLIGAGRSGTKFLRSLLEASHDVVAIPYDIGYVWRYGNESFSHDEFTADMADECVIKYVRKTLPKLVREAKVGARFLVEKSVPNTLRPEFLYKIFPEAKFVHLIRDGRAVTESSMRMWSTPVGHSYLLNKIKYFPWSNYKYAFWYIGNMLKGIFSSGKGSYVWGPRYKGIEEDASLLPLEVVCARQWKKCVEISEAQLASIPDDQVIEIRYESLVSNDSELRSLCEFIGLSDVERVLSNYQSSVKVSNTEKWKKTLDDILLEHVNKEIGNLNTRLGYHS
ncbi:MAG: sulfotransferase [Gammaproteobacteria bacterium]|nr:sulfotransferase [Gammaproteobacteria bacterium]